MSVFCQYVPYELANGDWDSRRDEIAALAIERSPPSPPTSSECIEELQVLGPPDIEERIGLTGGHIFQGEALPGQMWDRRLEARTPVEGLYLCGAATHPGGSVIGAQRADRRHAGARGSGEHGGEGGMRLPPESRAARWTAMC